MSDEKQIAISIDKSSDTQALCGKDGSGENCNGKLELGGDGSAEHEKGMKLATDGKNFIEAIKWFELATQLGHVPSMTLLGNIYLRGTETIDAALSLIDPTRISTPIKPSFARAKKYYSMAIEKAGSEAGYSLEYVLKAWEEPKPMDHHIENANKLKAIATLFVGLQYKNGKDGVGKDYATAAYYLEQAAISSNALVPIAAKALTEMYRKGGNGIEKNDEHALRHAELGLSVINSEFAEQTIEARKEIIANIYLIGDDFDNAGNYKRALSLYERILELQDAPSFIKCNVLVALGRLYKDGLGVKQDFFRAFSYYEKASSAACEPNNYEVKHGNDTDDFYNTAMQVLARPRSELGQMYIFGIGVERDAIKGIELLTAAHNLVPHPSYAKLLCTAYTEGVPGIEIDLNKAVQYCEKAPEEFLQ